MKPLNKHVFFISSWYPGPSTSAGTFIQTQIKALQECDVKCAIMFTAEFTLGNFVKAKIQGQPLFNIRKSTDIQMVWNLVVHRLPLRYYRNVLETRRQKIQQSAIKKFGEYIKSNGKPDFIFHHGVFDYVYLTKAISERFDVPYYFMEHSAFVTSGSLQTTSPFDDTISLHAFVNRAQARFAVTRTYANKFSEVFGVHFSYCPNVLSSEFFLDPSENLGTDKSEVFTFVNVGILERHKNQELLIRAFAKAFRGQSDVVLKIVGDGRLGPDLKKLATELNVVDQVEILGFLRPDAIRVLLDSSHAFVLSSTFETFGVVLIEAMARGLPVISSDIEGPSELIHAANGMLFKNGSVDDLSLKLVEMLNGYSQYDRERIIRETFKCFGSKAFMEHLSVSDLNQ